MESNKKLDEEVLKAAQELFRSAQRTSRFVYATWEDLNRAYEAAGGEEWGPFGDFCEALGIDMFIPESMVESVDKKLGVRWVAK